MKDNDFRLFLEYVYPLLVSIIPTVILIVWFYFQKRIDKKDKIKQDIRNYREKIINIIDGTEKTRLSRLGYMIDGLHKNSKKVTKKEDYINIPTTINTFLVMEWFEEYLVTKQIINDRKKDITTIINEIIEQLSKLNEITEK